MSNKNYWIYLAFMLGMIVGVVSILFDISRDKKKETIPKECKCTSAKEIILAYEQYQTFIDSVANPKYKKQHLRYADSINKINLILQQ